ncbi:MAG TPA: biotin/lipoyl-containing protein, partial [Rhizomicrobium sp.]|nr:biotin/lipoyl-containing protein [Rhizomicrobium sp.]
MPALSPTMEEGKLAKWLVSEGDEVKSGDILAEIETDKATMEFEAVDEGRIGKILVPEGTEGVKVNQPIATLIGEDESTEGSKDIETAMSSIKDAVAAESKTAKPAPASPPHPNPLPQGGEGVNKTPSLAPGGGEGRGEGATVSTKSVGRIFASPLARKIAEQKNVDLTTLHGSGPRGRIVKADVESAKAGTKAPAAKAAPAAQPSAQSTAISGIAPLPDAKLYFKPDDY